MTIDELIKRVNALAATQHGLVRLDQFDDKDHRRIRYLAQRGIVTHAAKGVYQVSGAPVTWLQSLQVAWWALSQEAVVSHASAARLHGLDRFHGVDSLDLTLRRVNRNRRVASSVGVTLHSAVDLPASDVRRVHGLAVTSPERTIIDLARSGTAEHLLEAAIDSSLRLRLTTLDHIVDRLAVIRGPARRGVARLDNLVLTSGGHSVLERQFLKLVRSAGLPVPVPQVVHRAGGRHVARVDFLFPYCDVVVEVSGGRGHSSASERAKDARRRNELQQMGRTVLEFTYEDVVQRDAYVVRTLRPAVSRS